MKHKKVYVVLAAVVASHLLCHAAYGDPAPCGPNSTTPMPCPQQPSSGSAAIPGLIYLHILSDFDIKTSGGSELHLPSGFFVDEPNWKKLDDAFKVRADEGTRLTAENKALKEALSGWQPGWKTLASALAVGLVGGWYLHDKL